MRVHVEHATALLRAISSVDESSTLPDIKSAVSDRGRLMAILDAEGARLVGLLAAHTGCPEEAFGEAVDDEGQPATDWGLPVELPRSVLEDLLPEALVTPVVMKGGLVVHALGRLDLGRTTRLANAAQRRVLRALYPRCGVPDCEVPFRFCKIHHVVWWRHGGRTDLDNLLPVCVGHHTEVHRDGWEVKLQPDRTLTIVMPSGEVMTCGPPKRAP